MDIKRNGTQASAKGPVEWFTGSVRIDSPDQQVAAHQPGSEDAKDVVATLIPDVGFEPVDAGPLRIARYPEPSHC
jgi:hypothetical protein